MVAAAFSSGFDFLYPAGVVVTAAVLVHYRGVYAGFPIGISWVSVGIGVAVFVAWITLDTSVIRNAGASGSPIRDVPNIYAYVWVAFRIVGSVLTVPIAEELAFRGYLLRKLVDRDFERVVPTRFTWLSFLGTSILFGLMHRSLVAGTLAGAAFAFAVYHRGRVTDAIVAHATANLLIAASVIGLGWWDLWL